MTPTHGKPTNEWFREQLRDIKGPLLAPYERLSNLLPTIKSDFTKRFVIVLDQFENAILDDSTWPFISSLAGESVRVKSYVVLHICNDVSVATSLWKWKREEGREKIKFIEGNNGAGIDKYQWDETDITKWKDSYYGNNNFLAIEMDEKNHYRSRLIESAVIAATPGFLVDNIGTHVDYTRRWKLTADFIKDSWSSGLQHMSRVGESMPTMKWEYNRRTQEN